MSILITTLFFLFSVYKFLRQKIEKLNLHQQYLYWDFILLIFSWLFLFFIIDKCFIEQSLSYLVIYAWISGISAICLLSFRVVYKKSIDLKKLAKRFAYESCGLNDDNLEFKESAINVGKGISELKKYVNVVVLNGGYGEGKSSYTRMIIESIPEKELLYSYISLTEANATEDFKIIC